MAKLVYYKKALLVTRNLLFLLFEIIAERVRVAFDQTGKKQPGHSMKMYNHQIVLSSFGSKIYN